MNSSYMRFPAAFFSGIVLAIGFSSCLQQPRNDLRYAIPVPIPFTYQEKSAAFDQNYLQLSIDSVSNTLRIGLSSHCPISTRFPIHNNEHDTLSETGFLLELFADGQPLVSDYRKTTALTSYNRLHMQSPGAPMRYATDTINLLQPNYTGIDIPYYAFHGLTQGTHLIELRVSQRVFRSNHDFEEAFYDSTFMHPSTHRIRHRELFPLIHASVRFTLHVPAIYETVLYSNTIQVKNDSTFNPYSSDNTIWNSSLPDMYWAVFYPTDNFYTASDYIKSTTTYDRVDTVTLYHYSVQDSIGFAVYDHDNLSRDDGLGYKIFPLSRMIREKKLNATFDYIKLFSLKAEPRGVVNRPR